MKRKIALGILTVAVLVGSGFCIYATEKSKISDEEALRYIDKAKDSSFTNKSSCASVYSSAVTNRQILEELRAMNKTLTEINNKLK